MRNMMLALGAAAMVAPVAVPMTPAKAQSDFKTWRGKDGRLYCRRSNGTTGLVIGGVGGALIGSAVGGTAATIIGAGAGALAGREIQKSRSKRRCR